MTAPPATTPCIAAYDAAGHCHIIEFSEIGCGRRRFAAAWRAWGFQVRRTTYGQADADMRAGIAERAKVHASALARRG